MGSDQDDAEIKKLIGDEITSSVKENITEPVMQGMEGSDKKKSKGKHSNIHFPIDSYNWLI